MKRELKIDRTKIPTPEKSISIHFPEYFETTLDNGIRLIVIENNKLPLVTARFVFFTGSLYDHGRAGLASLTADLITKGTSTMTAPEIYESIEFFGASISGGCDSDASYLNFLTLKKYFPAVMNIACSLINDSVFPEHEVEDAKLLKINSLLTLSDQGEYLVNKLFREKIYFGTPYENKPEGTKNAIEKITREDINGFYKKYYKPNNLAIAMIGDISPDEALDIVNENFHSAEKGEIEYINSINPPPLKKNGVFIINRKGAVQSDICLGHISVRKNNPDNIKLTVLNTLLGGYFISRINRNLREEKGYSYGARSSFNLRRISGDFSVDTNVSNALTGKAIKEIIKEIDLIRNHKVSEEELENVKNYICGSFPLQLETPNVVAAKILNLLIYEMDKNFYDSYIAKVMEVTAEDILYSAQKYLNTENLTIAIAGNPEDIKPYLKEFGEIEIIN